ncbi:hypothetical protein [Amycolatopsis sp. NPDC059657]|uniref:hypothetical protein n=1 Tax=Amycolatopsis sp. NPDC059657 TaxID=3346899 RepID=UPI0036709F17
MNPPDSATMPRQAAGHALAFIESAVDSPNGMLSRIAFEPSFEDTVALTEARAVIERRLGADIGFELTDDLSAAILGLPLLPWEERDLVEHFGRLIGRGTAGRRVRLFVDGTVFPADTDCTAVAAQALHDTSLISGAELIEFAEELLSAAAQNVVMVYWPDGGRGAKFDPVAAANALCVLKEAQRRGMRTGADVIEATREYVTGHLESGAYLNGSRYYPSPDAFLQVVSRLAERFDDLRDTLEKPLAEAIMQREDDEWVLDVALRAIAADNIGLEEGQRQRKKLLIESQEADGSWPAAPYYKLGRFPVYFGSRVLTTLFAANALRRLERS